MDLTIPQARSIPDHCPNQPGNLHRLSGPSARYLFYQLVGHWLQARAYRTGRGARAQLANTALRADEAPQRLHVCVSESCLERSCPSAIAIAWSDGTPSA